MKSEELVAFIAAQTDAVDRHEVLHGQLSVWVPNDRWVEFALLLRDQGRLHFDMPTFLTAVDNEDEGFEVVLNMYSVRRAHRILVKTTVSREDSKLPTLSHVWAGINWCERETWELFGIEFEGHPNLVKLLLPVEFEGFPLRKDFALMTRNAKEWPGLKEPGEA